MYEEPIMNNATQKYQDWKGTQKIEQFRLKSEVTPEIWKEYIKKGKATKGTKSNVKIYSSSYCHKSEIQQIYLNWKKNTTV